ncbi:hypothetical protein NKK48_01375 [Mesorhizobium sp. C386A]|uniref:hypothetical protein n=1 Tax=unclassified Mesorhizobium TaxID=325217 RepID=UPI0003CE8B1B|nr:hypothetical protein [Mesorhizobium sp. LNJC386A00]ESY35732.1 hypothetical protein X748_14050 [Mesorhizobium sp. LNJC386A00]
MTPEWTPGQQTDAQAEGWDIFEASGSELNKDGDRPFQLQACDEADIFKGYTRDTDAWQHVYDQAHAGSQLHQQALNFLRAGSLPEFEAIIHECSPDGCELNEEYQWPML